MHLIFFNGFKTWQGYFFLKIEKLIDGWELEKVGVAFLSILSKTATQALINIWLLFAQARGKKWFWCF